MQLTHYNSDFKSKKFPITVVCDNVNKAPNIGALFRISDAFGVEQLIFCGNTVALGKRFTKTSRATEKTVNYDVKNSAIEVVSAFKKQNYTIVALEITKNSIPINTFTVPKTMPIVLVVGNENFGISDEILSISDSTVHITMFGLNSSMNVVQATNIALYEMTKQLNTI